ncbi:FliI/YscN family ATPase [Gymnodinialimonas hymeniacidonis]|uniref:FliI/YscN family ATPase n=1 Tax=Gymnodinialimonas hymeniacidonis TaxID=3126508 RepID=UPI0034C67FB1
MQTTDAISLLRAQLKGISTSYAIGEVTALGRSSVSVSGLNKIAALGDRVRFSADLTGEILAMEGAFAQVMPEGPTDGLRLGARVSHIGPQIISPDVSWLGRVIDPDGQPLDGRALHQGLRNYPLINTPPSPTGRRGLGQRLGTGHAVFDTLLPIVEGQRVGLFAGSGVGKSRLIAALAQEVQSDVVVIGLIGERGREVRDFVAETLGPKGLSRAVVIAATSDRPAPTRARAAFAMMAVAEYFRDQGRNVLLLADSITRFAEAQRDVAAAAGEPFGPSGFPASMAQSVMGLAERAGPGIGHQGNITAIFSVLVAGSDMEGPVADVTRGVLDGHVVLSREIAERGRFPAIDVLRSVSRSLPGAASEDENRSIQRARHLIAAYDKAEVMVQAGLYSPGSDPLTDAAVKVWPELDAFVAERNTGGVDQSFEALEKILSSASPVRKPN